MITLLGILCLLLVAATAYFANKYYDTKQRSDGFAEALGETGMSLANAKHEAERYKSDLEQMTLRHTTSSAELDKYHKCYGKVPYGELVERADAIATLRGQLEEAADDLVQTKSLLKIANENLEDKLYADNVINNMRTKQNELISDAQVLTAQLAKRTEEAEQFRFRAEWAERQRAIVEAELFLTKNPRTPDPTKAPPAEPPKPNLAIAIPPAKPAQAMPKKRASRTKRA